MPRERFKTEEIIQKLREADFLLSPGRNLPSYVVLTSLGNREAQPLYSRLWASGFLPTEHSGVKLRNTGAPVFYLSNPPGIDRCGEICSTIWRAAMENSLR